MSNDKIAKDEVRENISSKSNLNEFDKFNDFDLAWLIYKTNIMASIVSGNIERLQDFITVLQDQNKNEIKERLYEIDLLFTYIEGQLNAAQTFMRNTLTSS